MHTFWSLKQNLSLSLSLSISLSVCRSVPVSNILSVCVCVCVYQKHIPLSLSHSFSYALSLGKSMDPQYLFHYAACDIICSVIFGSRFDYDDAYFKELIAMIANVTKLVISPWAMVLVRSFILLFMYWSYFCIHVGSINYIHCLW